MKTTTKLTSVNVLVDNYNKFKVKAIDSEINLQKFVNRALNLYISDDEFREKIDKHDKLANNGSKF